MTIAWVAGGTNNAATTCIATSEDGVTWTAQTTPMDGGEISGVAYNSGLWVAVGTSSGTTVVMTSPDGVTWTARTTPLDGGFANCVAYGAGLWVVGGKNGTTYAATSPDGITWTARTVAAQVNGIAWNGSLFVATGNLGSVATSPDGITWTNRSFDLTTGYAVAWNGTTWVIAAGDQFHDATAATSPTGVTWTDRSTPFDSGNVASNMFGIASDGSGFVGVGSRSGSELTICTSPDGVTWTARTSPLDSGDAANGAAYGNGLWVALGASASHFVTLCTSPDGITWTARSTPFDDGFPSGEARCAAYKLVPGPPPHRRFFPPYDHLPFAKPIHYWTWLRGISLYRMNGVWIQERSPFWGNDQATGVRDSDIVARTDRPGGEKTDYTDRDRYLFLGGRVYEVSDAVATELDDAGYGAYLTDL